VSGRGLCIFFVQRSRNIFDREASIIKRPWSSMGRCAMVLVQDFPRLVVCSSISIIPPTPRPYESYQNNNLVHPDKHQYFDAEETRLLPYYIFMPLKLCEKDFVCNKLL